MKLAFAALLLLLYRLPDSIATGQPFSPGLQSETYATLLRNTRPPTFVQPPRIGFSLVGLDIYSAINRWIWSTRVASDNGLRSCI
jgi:hypothetical protein